MNETFNIKRFGNYFASDLKKCLSNYGLTLILLSLLGIITYFVVAIFSLLLEGQWNGTGPALRFMVLGFSIAAMIVTLPTQCYGELTDKRSGSLWLMIPVSTLEKYLSMILNTAFVLPAILFLGHMTADWILCFFDNTCGTSFFGMIGDVPGLLQEIPVEYAHIVKPIFNPAIYIDDVVGTILAFLLGALIFKKNKGVKTIIAIIVIASVVGMFSTPFIMDFSMKIAEEPMTIFDSPLWQNMLLLDTINDIIIFIGLMIAIFFKIKTLKH